MNYLLVAIANAACAATESRMEIGRLLAVAVTQFHVSVFKPPAFSPELIQGLMKM